jgi:molybdate transport system regulatory protein
MRNRGKTASEGAPALGVRSKVWFVCGGKHAFGPGLARLLTGVERHGSLRAAARAERMSYRHAWAELRNAEEALGKPLILRRAGGAGGGGSTLSEDGRRMLALFVRASREVAEHADACFARMVRGAPDGAVRTDDTA